MSSELDDVGLVGAIRERLSEAHTPYDRGIEIELDAPDDLPSLSPAVELAAYRITNEALANVFRHADGGSCVIRITAGVIRITAGVIRITAGNELEITVCNDGTPPSSWTAGVGLSSIVDRAEEVGGNATVGPTDEGWTVVAHLPLDRRSASVRP
ncbi:sensor histidine kinase [Aeromicrobium sp.]|uniref:sensor histidine kinase n=1 Tax=Aeromicrobium sp. TaxID=1871063 RepID=UPI003D6BB6B0